MPWVNIFEHEPCQVWVGFPVGVDASLPDRTNIQQGQTAQVFLNDSQVPMYHYMPEHDARVVYNNALEGYNDRIVVVIPSGGVAGRRFRGRLLGASTAYNEWTDACLMFPAYLVSGYGLQFSYDESAFFDIPIEGTYDSQWYEFQEVPAEPQGFHENGWVGLAGLDGPSPVEAGNSAANFEWQVWVDDCTPEWVPLHEAGVKHLFMVNDANPNARINNDVLSMEFGDQHMKVVFEQPVKMRVTILEYQELPIQGESYPASICAYDCQSNESGDPQNEFSPAVFEDSGVTNWFSFWAAEDQDNNGARVSRVRLRIDVWACRTGSTRPWWMCPPKPPVEPCPVRPTEFVDFANYDPDFKFPLKSSRVPVKIERSDGCVVCSPSLINEVEPDPPVPPTPPPTNCASMQVTPYDPTQLQSDITNPPSWFIYADTTEFVLAFEGDWDNYYHFTYNDGYYSMADGTLPFSNYDEILQMMIAYPVNNSPNNFNWSCINVSTYAPA